jgi:phage terminase small subunit
MALKDKQRRFCEEYLIDLDLIGAYRRAGYKPKSDEAARTSASRLFRNATVFETIKAALDARAARVALDQDWVLERLRLVSDRCVQGEPVLDREGNETGQWRFDAAGANRATELIGKHLGMFIDRHEVTFPQLPNLAPADVAEGQRRLETLRRDLTNGNGATHHGNGQR